MNINLVIRNDNEINLPVIIAVRRWGGQKQNSVTWLEVELEPYPLGPAIPAKYFNAAFMIWYDILVSVSSTRRV